MSAAATSSEAPDKVMDRNRLNYWVQHIGKLLNKCAKKMSPEDLQQIKYATSKLLQLIQQMEKSSKDLFLKQHASIDTLITVLQIVTCEQTVSNVINIFIDMVGKSQPVKRASSLVNHGLTTVLFQILKLAHTNDMSLSDDILISIHVLLSRIGHKDRKFAVKARLHQSLMLTLSLVKSHFHNFRTLQPLLQVLKLYTNNSVNASYLGKHNSINLMFKVISACGKRHTVDLRLALENLNNMTRSKSNSARLIGMGGVPQLLVLHSEWQQMDTKHRNLTIRRSILHILKNITNLKSGRKVFVEADGIRILYESALEASDCRDMESLILLASVILRKCCPRNKLPLESTLSPVLFQLPVSSNHTPECYFLANFPVPSGAMQDDGAVDESDHSSLDDDDDIDSDDERFRTDPEEPDEDQQDGPEPAEKRTFEDLRMYDMFFPELLDQQGRCSSEELDDDMSELMHDTQLFSQMAAQTHSVHRFQKLAFPDLYGVTGHTKMMEPLSSRKFGVQRTKIFEDIDRMIHADQLVDRVVYDLDQIVAEAGACYSGQNSNLSNRDELRVGFLDSHSSALKFNAQFECGNLRKVIQVRQCEYDLILNPDINTNHHHQWFYFEVSNMQAGQPYRFNIVNCEKINSQFNFGMQPLMMSVMEALQGNPVWQRVGTEICYYKNHFIRNSNTTGGVQGKAYYTTTFTITFQHTGDICYLSYHYPYSYTALKTQLKQWEKQVDNSQIYFRNQTLCTTLGGNTVPVLTITAQPRALDKEGLEEFRSRPYIFLSGRVHPGESNASWIMKGTIDFLLSKKPAAQQVREMYIFKIVPMLNPDGVLNGNHRSSLVAEDLNRRWGKPCSILHPTIYHTKGLLLYLNMINKTPMVYCDYHGHSRRKNIFMYGCSPNQSWIPNDSQNPTIQNGKPNDLSFKQLPRLLHMSCAAFSLQNCSFVVEKVKENTARVIVWRQIGVVRSYTMESSYCGCDQGKYKDMHINTSMLEEMGQKFCETLIKLAKQKGSYDQQMPVFDQDTAVMGGSTAEDFIDELDETSSEQTSKKVTEMATESLMDATDSDDDLDDDEDEDSDDDNLME